MGMSGIPYGRHFLCFVVVCIPRIMLLWRDMGAVLY